MDNGLLKGKRGIVLGVANDRSIAWACARECAAQGAELAFNYLGTPQQARLEELIKDLPGALAFPCDVSKDSEIESFFEQIKQHWDGVDFVIHSIAYTDRSCLRGRFLDTSREHFSMTLDISAYSLVSVARAVEPLMRRGGSIVSMSYYGAEKVVPRYNVMGVAKAALEMTTKYLAEDLGVQGIRVNCVSAGPIRTLSSSAIPGIQAMLDAAQRHAPLRRNVTVEDVGRATLFLLSDLAAGITGEVMHVDAGYNIVGMFGPSTTPLE